MKKRYKKRKRTISNLDVVNSILTTLLVVLGILVGWTMFKYDFLNFRGINFGIIIVMKRIICHLKNLVKLYMNI